jgi:3-hydroxyacyl-[acyl-carrier-protein] dehydratase
MDREQIMALLPHRPPMLMVDRIVEIEPGHRAVGEHDVTAAAFWCQGHFPGDPVMPGVLIAEALAQVAALVHLAAHPDAGGSTVLLAGMDKLRFRKPVRPGDVLRLEVEAVNARRGIYQFDAVAHVDGKRVANGRFLAAVQRD